MKHTLLHQSLLHGQEDEYACSFAGETFMGVQRAGWN